MPLSAFEKKKINIQDLAVPAPESHRRLRLKDSISSSDWAKMIEVTSNIRPESPYYYFNVSKLIVLGGAMGYELGTGVAFPQEALHFLENQVRNSQTSSIDQLELAAAMREIYGARPMNTLNEDVKETLFTRGIEAVEQFQRNSNQPSQIARATSFFCRAFPESVEEDRLISDDLFMATLLKSAQIQSTGSLIEFFSHMKILRPQTLKIDNSTLASAREVLSSAREGNEWSLFIAAAFNLAIFLADDISLVTQHPNGQKTGIMRLIFNENVDSTPPSDTSNPPLRRNF